MKLFTPDVKPKVKTEDDIKVITCLVLKSQTRKWRNPILIIKIMTSDRSQKCQNYNGCPSYHRSITLERPVSQ